MKLFIMKKLMMKRTTILLSLLLGLLSTAAAQNVELKARGIYTDGAVTLNVNKTADGSYQLYDAPRHIYTINNAMLPSLDTLAEQGRLREFFPNSVEISEHPDRKELDDLFSILTRDKALLTKYLHSAIYTVPASDAEGDAPLEGFRLKSIRIEKITSPATQEDYNPSPESPLAGIRVHLLAGHTYKSNLFDYVNQMITAFPVVIDDISPLDRMLPREGATFSVSAISGDIPVAAARARGIDDMDIPEGMTREDFRIFFVPDGSGSFNFDQDGLKGTIFYEPAPTYIPDVHWGMERVYDFYKNVLGRDSYDGEGAPIYNMVFVGGHAMRSDGSIEEEDFPYPEEDESMAMFDLNDGQVGAEAQYGHAVPMLLYGAGGYYAQAMTYTHPMAELSIMCHEFTHLVTESTARFMNLEGGALNESFSDIMSISMMKNADYGYGPETPWVVGGRNVVVGLSCLRNLANPEQGLDGRDPFPSTYMGKYWNSMNKYNMGAVQCKFYYLLCDGGEGTNDNGLSYDLKGIGMDKGTKIAFLTLTKYCQSDTDFSTIGSCWLKAAQELYGAGSTESRAVVKAWEAVGITIDDAAEETGIDEIVNSTSAESKWFDLQGRTIVNSKSSKNQWPKGIYVKNGKKIICR